MKTSDRFANSFHSPESGIDLPMLRHELEGAAQHPLMDLTHELCCQREEMPALQFWLPTEQPSNWHIARLMATCFEAGRRYGLLSAIGFMNTIAEPNREAEADRIRTRYDNTRTIREAENLNDFDTLWDAAKAEVYKDFPTAAEAEDSSTIRLMRLRREFPQLYEDLRRATIAAAEVNTNIVYPDLPHGQHRIAKAPRGTCQRPPDAA